MIEKEEAASEDVHNKLKDEINESMIEIESNTEGGQETGGAREIENGEDNLPEDITGKKKEE
ncbi:hypothetical protein [Robinsoniella sp. KNHs210]|uniref:hypothetical protein n=1 Tax=Robinsoniella sp. KNHs210 TaxID=1469950 RepID=UPI000488E3AD|nr:hypothetical protein [Robinsoniella sp. KNHs210]